MTLGRRQAWIRFLGAAAVANALAILLASYYAFAPFFSPRESREAETSATVPDYDYSAWRQLPIQQGRIKPLDSFARDSVRQITGRTHFEKHDPVAIVMAWWLTGGKGAMGYTNWEDYPFVLCDHHGLRARIFEHTLDATGSKLPGKRISPVELRNSPGFDALVAEVSKARQEFAGKAHLHLSREHLKAEEVGRRLVLYDQICGRAITRLHTNALSSEQFIDVPQLAAVADKNADAALSDFEQRGGSHPDPLHIVVRQTKSPQLWLSIGALRRSTRVSPQEIAVLTSFGGLASAYASGDPRLFAESMNEWNAVLQRVSSPSTDFEVPSISLELAYNRYQPFLWAWVSMLVGTILLFAALMTSSRIAYALGLLIYLTSLGIQIAGFYARVTISGWAPVTNMYESVIFVAFIAAVFALALELIYRRTVIALAGAVVATLGLVLADQLPLAFDPKISPIVPVLRDNYWLTIHVLTIVCGYGAGTLAWGLGNVSLAMLVFGKGSEENLKMLARFTYRAMQLAVLLLATGTFLGGWWAAEAWGRFWGWDPKEVGALFALVCYVIPLHARYIGWVSEFGLAVSAVLCFAAILVSWYVVNFVIAAGLHSYGFGGGGGQWVLWAGLLNLEWVFIASLLYLRKPTLHPTAEYSVASTG
jgi:ABC-type transport system involved in cytochrome c biogenesis permease subunit